MIQENVKVMIVDDNSETSRTVKEIVQSCDDIVVLGGPDKSTTFDFHNFNAPHTPFNARLKPTAEHGAYRQFIKKDKSKNLKANK